jgi:hypothetical protein
MDWLEIQRKLIREDVSQYKTRIERLFTSESVIESRYAICSLS